MPNDIGRHTSVGWRFKEVLGICGNRSSNIGSMCHMNHVQKAAKQRRNDKRAAKRGLNRSSRRNKEYIAWRHLTRNQQEVAKRILDGKYHLVKGAGWGFLDNFLIFLKSINFLACLDVNGEGYARRMVTIAKLLLTYNVKILMGISHMNQVPQLLFGDIGLLMMLGFTAEQIENGYCKRGKKNGYGKREKEKSKPLSKDTLSDALARFSPAEMERILNGGVKILAKKGFIKDRIYIEDATEIVATEKCEGCGRKTVTEKKRDRNGKEVEFLKTTFGFKLMIIRSLESRIVVAAKLVQIQESEKSYALELLKTAIENIGAGKIKLLLMDRGYIDGLTLWKIKHGFGIDFIIPARNDMAVTKDARGLIDVIDKKRIFHQERKDPKTKLITRVVGICNLTTYDQYGDENHQQKNSLCKNFKGNLINAVMVTKWEGKDYKHGKEKVFLTTLYVSKPLKIIDDYDLRSLIENTSFRELKQGWLINKIPKKIDWAVNSHVMLTLCMYNMTNAFRTDLGQDITQQGIRRFRRETLHNTRDKVVILTDEHYGIFDLEELMLLLGKPPLIFTNINPEMFKVEYGLK